MKAVPWIYMQDNSPLNSENVKVLYWKHKIKAVAWYDKQLSSWNWTYQWRQSLHLKHIRDIPQLQS